MFTIFILANCPSGMILKPEGVVGSVISTTPLYGGPRKRTGEADISRPTSKRHEGWQLVHILSI